MKHMNDDRYFIDTNVILYAYDPNNRDKRERARAWLQWLWENAAGSLSWQVLQEFYVNAIRKFGAEPEKVRSHAKVLAEFDPPDVTLGLLERAWYWTDHAHVTFWDAMIVAAAERTRCRWLLSEDFQAGRQFGSLIVVSPFEKAPELDQT
jgi:predicted nucleic acid-binding protein